MSSLNPCVTGDTLLWTVDGEKSFKELAESNDDVKVYCLDENGDLKISKMYHPRLSGYKINIMKITLNDGSVLKVTPNHMILTDVGYVPAEDLFEDDQIAVLKEDVILPNSVEEDIKQFIEYTGTKKGTVIKKCEVTGDEFECVWDERELCTKEGYETDLYERKSNINLNSDNYTYVSVEKIEFLDERENVYNGTVGIYHNYFTIDKDTNTIVNQLNCGE